MTNDTITMLELTNKTCKWPIGDPQDSENFGFCGNHAPNDDGSYCEFHDQMAHRHGYVSKSQKRKMEKYKNAA